MCTIHHTQSIVGVAGGATRAALTQHQALRDNMADVSAKDGSQACCLHSWHARTPASAHTRPTELNVSAGRSHYSVQPSNQTSSVDV